MSDVDHSRLRNRLTIDSKLKASLLKSSPTQFVAVGSPVPSPVIVPSSPCSSDQPSSPESQSLYEEPSFRYDPSVALQLILLERRLLTYGALIWVK